MGVGVCICACVARREGGVGREGRGVVVVVVQTIKSARVSVQACTCVQLIQWLLKTSYACSGGNRSPASDTSTNTEARKNFGGAPTSSLGSPDPGRINFFHRSTNPGSPERLPAGTLPWILKRFQGRVTPGS